MKLFRFLVGLGLLVVIALFTALIAPYFIDWTAYKQDFEKQASRIIGQKVTVGGEASVRILPLPSIRFTELSVGESADGNAMMTVGQFRANVELMPFLSGEVRVVDMALIDPVFHLEIGEEGKVAWTDRREVLVDPDQVKLDKLSVRNAAFELKGVGPDRVITGRGINADVSALSLYGPWRIRGTGEVDGHNSRFELSTGRLSDENSIRLKAVLQRLDQPYTLTADGPVSLEDDVLAWIGEFELDPLTSRTELSGFEGREPLPVRVEGDFQLTPARLVLPKYDIRIGPEEDPFSLSGQGQVRLRGGIDFRLEIDGRQVDLNRIAQMRQGENASANTLETRIKLARDVLNQIPVPNFSGEIDFEIPAIIAGDTFIREISALVRPFGNGWEIVRLKSSLPGNTLVEARGRLGKGDEFGFHGNLLIASRQPSGFASWAAGRVDPAIRRLSSAGLSANVTLTPSQIGLDQMELILDENRLEGRLQRLSPVEAVAGSNAEATRPAIVANLRGDVVRLDDLQAISSLFSGDSEISLNNDFDITLKAKTLEAFDLVAGDADLQFQYKGGELSVARLNLSELLGASVTSTGQITNLFEQPRGNMAFEVKAASLQSVAAHLGERFGWTPVVRAFAEQASLSADTILRLEIDSRPVQKDDGEELRNRLLVDGRLAGTAVTLRGGYKGGLASLDGSGIDFSLEAVNDNAAVVLRQLGLGQYGFSPLPGVLEVPLSLSVESRGAGETGYETQVAVNLPDTSLSAQGHVGRLSAEQPQLEFDVTLGSGDIAPLVSSFGHVLPGLNPVIGDVAPFAARFNLSSGPELPVEIDITSGQIYGSGFSGRLKLEEVNSALRRWSGNLAVDHLSMDVMAGLASGTSFADGLGDWSDTSFPARPLSNQNGKIALTAATADLGVDMLAKDLAVSIDVDGGNFSANDLSFSWDGAEISGNIGYNLTEGVAVLNAQLFANGLSAEGLAKAFDLPVVIKADGSGSVTLDGSGKSPRALIGSMSGSGVVSMDSGMILGINDTRLEAVMAAADREGFEVSAESVGRLAEQAFLGGEIAFDAVSAPFSLASGEVQFRNIDFGDGSPPAGPVGDFSANLLNGEITAGIRLSPDAGAQAVSGAVPDVEFAWSGSADGVTRTVNTGSLEGFLSIRAFEAEQRRVETLQASILEKQRFRYELLKSSARNRWLEERRLEEERKAAEEAARKAREEEERRAREEAERLERERAEREAAEAAERERKAQEEAERKRQAELEEQRQALIRAEREAAEEARREAEAANAAESAQEEPPKAGFEVNTLPAPKPKPGLFDNIEKLLFD